MKGNLGLICLLLALMVLILATIGNEPIGEDDSVINYGTAVEWNGEQRLQLPTVSEGADSGIAIPCFSMVAFVPGEINQKVNIYNPQDNSCYMEFELWVDGRLLWSSDGPCMPGEGYYDIELMEPLPCGDYDGQLIYKCFAAKGYELNTAVVNIRIIVQ